jgi:hypothetical protein
MDIPGSFPGGLSGTAHRALSGFEIKNRSAISPSSPYVFIRCA